MDYREKFSGRLYALRQAEGLSLASLGAALSVTDEAIRLLEKGKRTPSFEMLISIAVYFGVSIDYLVGLSNEPTRR